MKNAIIVLFLCISTVAFGQDLDCKKFKNGKFSMTSDQVNFIIERNGNKQIESTVGTNTKSMFKIKWIDECTYTLRYKKDLSGNRQNPFPKKMILTIEIIEVKENSYIQRTSSNMFDAVIEGELFFISSE